MAVFAIVVSSSEASNQGKSSSKFLSNTLAAADSQVVAWTVHVQSEGSGFSKESAMFIFSKKDLRDCSSWYRYLSACYNQTDLYMNLTHFIYISGALM